MATKKPRKRRKRAEPRSRGLGARELGLDTPPAALAALARAVEDDGGLVLAIYKDPLGGNAQLLVSLPLERVQPTPFQRDLSEPHVKRLVDVLEKVGRFLDPIIAVRRKDGVYWTPNGNHRRAALTELGAKAIVALLVPDEELAYRILALNTEKAHNLREKALEVIRMARDLARIDPMAEKDYAVAFEEPSFVTLGVCYEKRPRFAGSTYHPVLKRVEAFLGTKLPKALEEREARAAKLLALDDAVSAAVAALKEKGFESPYLKSFVVARVNPLRFSKDAEPDWDATIDKMLAAAKRFDAAKIKPGDVARGGGPPAED